MSQRARKFAGVWLFLALLIVYPSIAVLLFVELIDPLFKTLPETGGNWATMVYFVVTGLAWAFPAGVIVKWMARPDEPV